MFKNVTKYTPGIEASYVEPPHTSVANIVCIIEGEDPVCGTWINTIREEFNHHLTIDILICDTSKTPTENSIGIILSAFQSTLGFWKINVGVKGLVPIAHSDNTLLSYTINGWKIQILQRNLKIDVDADPIWDFVKTDIEVAIGHIRHNPYNYLLGKQ